MRTIAKSALAGLLATIFTSTVIAQDPPNRFAGTTETMSADDVIDIHWYNIWLPWQQVKFTLTSSEGDTDCIWVFTGPYGHAYPQWEIPDSWDIGLFMTITISGPGSADHTIEVTEWMAAKPKKGAALDPATMPGATGRDACPVAQRRRGPSSPTPADSQGRSGNPAAGRLSAAALLVPSCR